MAFVEKVKCKNCGASILPQTAKKFDGLCAQCGQRQQGQVILTRPKITEPAPIHGEKRTGDGTVLAKAIARGAYKPEAGTEKLGYFDPKVAPFRVFPDNKLAFLHGSLANQLTQMMQSVGGDAIRRVYGSMFDKTGDIAVDIGRKLGLSSTEEVINVFQKLAKQGNTSEFLLVTTTMPFFLTYSRDKVVVLAEVEQELRLNALANLLLNDPEFTQVHSVADFRERLGSLLVKRRGEFEEKRAWAIELKKSKGM